MRLHIFYNEPGDSKFFHRSLRRTLHRFVLYSAFFAFLILAGCNNKKQLVASKQQDVYYTCSMHPQIMQDHPGTCPICHMELIAVNKSSQPNDAIMLNEQQVQLGNIQTDTLGHSVMGDK